MCSSPKIVDPKKAMVTFYANRNSMTSMVTTRLTEIVFVDVLQIVACQNKKTIRCPPTVNFHDLG